MKGAIAGLALTALGVMEAGPSDPAEAANDRVRITFTENGASALTAVTGSVYYQAPRVGVRELRLSTMTPTVELGPLHSGRYRFTAVAQSLSSVFVASRVAEVDLSSGNGLAELTIDLVERPGWATIVDGRGGPVPGAHFYTNPAAVNSSADDQGRINLSTIATGTALTVRTIHWGVTCRVISSAAEQRIPVPDATDDLVIATPPASAPMLGYNRPRQVYPSPRLVGAMLSGVPGSTCPVPYEHLPVRLVTREGRTLHTISLPPGDYTLTLLDGQTFKVSAPGTIELR